MPLFRISGIAISVDWTWLIALGYVVLTLSGDYQSLLGENRQAESFAWAVGASFAFFGSIVLHELGHAFVARRNGIGILGIDLWLLGGLAKMDREPATPGVEFRVAAAGPAVTAFIAAACIGSAFAIDANEATHMLKLQTHVGDAPWLVALTSLGTVNLFLLVFNLIPAYPLDGGRIARAIAWKINGDRDRSTRISAQIGRVFGYLLMFFGVLWLANSVIGGILFIFMGMTLAQAARGAMMQSTLLGEATHLTVADVMDRQPVVVPGEATVQRALDEFFWRYRWPWFPVVDAGGHFLGLIEQHAVELVEEDDRDARHASELVAPQSGSRRSVPDDTPLTALLANEDIRDYGALMAIDDAGLLSGVITIEQVQRALRDAIQRATKQAPASDL